MNTRTFVATALVAATTATAFGLANDSIMRIAPDGGIANKFWRFRIKQTRNWWYDESKANPGHDEVPIGVALRGLAFYDRDGNRICSGGTSGNEVLGWGRTTTNANSSVFNILYFDETSAHNFSQGLGSGSGQVAHPDPADESTWIGMVFEIAETNKSVGAYRLLTSGDHSDRDPYAWEFSVADSQNGPWQVVEDHAESAADEFYTRLGTAARVSWEAFNGGYEMVFSAGLSIHGASSGSSNLVGRASLFNGLDSDARVFGDVASTESIVKDGASSVELLGNGAAANVTVSGGKLTLGSYQQGFANKYWRWRIKKLRGWLYGWQNSQWHDESYAPNGAVLRRFALYGQDGTTRLNAAADGTTVKTAINSGNGQIGNLLLAAGSGTENFNQALGSGSGQVAPPDPSDESTWIGFVFKIPDSMGSVYSYNLKTSGDHSDRDPIEWRLEAGDSVDGPWTIVDDHRESPKEFITRAQAGAITDSYINPNDPRPYGRVSWQVFNGGIVPLPLPYGGAILDKVCYGAGGVVSLANGGELVLPGFSTVTGELKIDCASGGGSISHLNPAAIGRIDLVNLPANIEFPYEIPLRFSNGVNLTNLKDWTVAADGITQAGWHLLAGDSSISVVKGGTVIIMR